MTVGNQTLTLCYHRVQCRGIYGLSDLKKAIFPTSIISIRTSASTSKSKLDQIERYK